MEAKINYSQEDVTRMEIRSFVNEGLQDAYQNRLLDFEASFDELEERYVANEWLSNYPYKFPLVQDDILQSQGIRCMPYKNYYIFYEIVEAMYVVIILRIGYNRRNWKDILS